MAEKDKEKTTENSVPPKFTLERLRQDCLQIFGVTTSTFDGAASGLDGKFTIDEIKTRIKEWQEKPIKLKGGKK